MESTLLSYQHNTALRATYKVGSVRPQTLFASCKEIGIAGSSGKFLLVESGMQLKESRILLTTGIQSPSPIDKDWNSVPGIRNMESRICLGFHMRWSYSKIQNQDQVFWARETEQPTQTLVFTKTAGRHNLVKVIVIWGLPSYSRDPPSLQALKDGWDKNMAVKTRLPWQRQCWRRLKNVPR